MNVQLNMLLLCFQVLFFANLSYILESSGSVGFVDVAFCELRPAPPDIDPLTFFTPLSLGLEGPGDL